MEGVGPYLEVEGVGLIWRGSGTLFGGRGGQLCARCLNPAFSTMPPPPPPPPLPPTFHRCGALHVGDQLLAINETSLENKAVNEAVQLLIHSDFHVKLDILPGRAIEQGPELTNDEGVGTSFLF